LKRRERKKGQGTAEGVNTKREKIRIKVKTDRLRI